MNKFLKLHLEHADFKWKAAYWQWLWDPNDSKEVPEKPPAFLELTSAEIFEHLISTSQQFPELWSTLLSHGQPSELVVKLVEHQQWDLWNIFLKTPQLPNIPFELFVWQDQQRTYSLLDRVPLSEPLQKIQLEAAIRIRTLYEDVAALKNYPVGSAQYSALYQKCLEPFIAPKNSFAQVKISQLKASLKHPAGYKQFLDHFIWRELASMPALQAFNDPALVQTLLYDMSKQGDPQLFHAFLIQCTQDKGAFFENILVPSPQEEFSRYFMVHQPIAQDFLHSLQRNSLNDPIAELYYMEIFIEEMFFDVNARHMLFEKSFQIAQAAADDLGILNTLERVVQKLVHKSGAETLKFYDSKGQSYLQKAFNSPHDLFLKAAWNAPKMGVINKCRILIYLILHTASKFLQANFWKQALNTVSDLFNSNVFKNFFFAKESKTQDLNHSM